MDARGRRREVRYVHDALVLPTISLEGRWFKSLRLKRHKRQLVIKLREFYITHKSHCARLAVLVAEVEVVAKRTARLAAAIAAKGPGRFHTMGIYGFTQLTADQYAQQCQVATQQFAAAITEDLQYFEDLSESLPKPELFVIKPGSTGSIRPNSLMLKPSQLEQDLHAQVVKMTKGKQSLFPICYEICLLQAQAMFLLDIIAEQAAAIDRLYCRLTVRGVYRGLMAHELSFPERLFNELSVKIHDEVVWLLAAPKYFDDVSPSEPACVVSEEEDVEQEQQQQQSSAAQDATCTVEVQVPGCSSRKKDKGKPNLGRRLLGGFGSGLGKLVKQAAKAAGKLLCIIQPAA